MPGEEARVKYMLVFMEQCSLHVCGFIVHTLLHLVIAAGNKTSKAFGSDLKCCKLRVGVLSMNKYIILLVLAAPTCLYLATVSSNVYSGYLLSTCSYGTRVLSSLFGVVYIVRPFPEQLNYCSCGMEFQKLFSSCCSVRVCLIESRRPPWFGFSQASLSVH